MNKMHNNKFGFTLIELLIVVAIIAILAAIAIPNFLAAQTRSKVSRTLAEFRTMATALESYYVDNNDYPATRVPQPLSTPVAYITSFPHSPWNEISQGLNANEFTTITKTYLYVGQWTDPQPQPAGSWGNNPNDIKQDYFTYMDLADPSFVDFQRVRWEMKSVGPDGIDDRSAYGVGVSGAKLYDPSNGTVSKGDIIWFNDGTGSGRGR